ncbi:hypothetical protein THIOM_002895 [Candidatus Thiomargarita nelsonii]|uniref:Uncharacterized protein n=1 Tax=Candidatus Thiomargarita nelsonii TaxID=1003181 RepID=A0A176RZU4_9GAMM|nr:hypothetical protein THIOM_002895 [Candidatus Thiomargarita nelsonii]
MSANGNCFPVGPYFIFHKLWPCLPMVTPFFISRQTKLIKVLSMSAIEPFLTCNRFCS